MILPSRRLFLTGLVSLLAAPVIVRVENIMPIKVIRPTMTYHWTINGDLFLRVAGAGWDKWERVDPREVFATAWNDPARPRFNPVDGEPVRPLLTWDTKERY